ncbi:sister chromatid cohesion protein Dcc1 [Lentinula aciculospora]|uniref:Sister chromatid cohesion protein Dcc1 n=1 Tax=Lentinula aciculospora TaxID=153920 RepID=A0A9W9AAI2_9AGAR|nr:sister chromatid cohesion protein Dcc1 [Lentinula aciculospora]
MDHNLRFSTSSNTDQGSYKLLELPPELYKLLEESLSSEGGPSASSFYIKGQPGEDAVLCTQDKTYAIRSVSLSNSILVVTSPPDSDVSSESEDNSFPNIIIRDQLHEILELTQAIPKLHKLNTLLKGREYGEDEEDNDDGMNVEQVHDGSQDIRDFTYTDAQAMIQASEAELNRGLRERRILRINEILRPISSSYLNKIIQFILNTLAALSLDHDSVPVEKLCTTLADEHDVPRIVSVQVMGWFGSVSELEGRWKMEVDAVVREAGLGILKDAQDRSLDRDNLISTWKDLVGDKFASSVSLDLLAGNYLIAPAAPYSDHQVVKYFSISSLPVDPAQRFADLFLTRSKWKNEDIVPFLSDIAVNSKERDKMLLKYARATTNAEGVWYTSRAQYNG